MKCLRDDVVTREGGFPGKGRYEIMLLRDGGCFGGGCYEMMLLLEGGCPWRTLLPEGGCFGREEIATR